MLRKCLILIALFGCSVTLFKNKFHQPKCPQDSANLLNLFIVMCTNIANGTNVTLRDGCIGCFQSASNVNNQPSLSAITDCASTYLPNSNYSDCFNLPQTPPADNGIDPRSIEQCVTGYCGYARCIRSVNSNILISTCYNEARLLTNASFPDQQVGFYKNVTACILARSRCSTSNPITGRPQNGRYQTTKLVDKFGKVSLRTTGYYYSLQITSTGELRIIGLPDTLSVQNDFCSVDNNLNEATWTNNTC